MLATGRSGGSAGPAGGGPGPVTVGWQRRIDRAMNHLVTEAVVAALIVLSVGLLLYEAALDRGSERWRLVTSANDLITWAFVAELTLRFVGERRKRRFFRRFWLDILAVLPVFRAFRMLRILRLLRLFRLGAIFLQHARQYLGVLRHVKLEYLFGSLVVLVVVLMGALSMRFTEGVDAEGFTGIEDALWYALMTLAASEPILAEPYTRGGRAVTLVLMLGGMTVFAFFTGTVSAVMIDSLRKLRFKQMELHELEGHVVVCGWNLAGALFLEELLRDATHQVVVISDSREASEASFDGVGHLVHVVEDDFTKASVLRRAGVERAAFAVVLADGGHVERSSQDRDARTVLAAMLVEKMNPGIHTTVQLLNGDNEVSLREMGVEDIIVSDDYIGGMMANVVRNRGMVPVIAEILTSRYGQQLYKVPAPRAVHGMTVGEAMGYLKAHHDATLIAVERPEEGFVVNPPSDLVVDEGHEIVVTALMPIS